MNKVLKIFIVIIVIAAIGAGIWVWLMNRPAEIPTNEPIVNAPAPPLDITLPGDNTPAEATADQQVKSLARLFATAYGSYSTDARFQNLKELNYLYTPSFAAYINQYISQTSAPAGYYSVNTRALSAAVVDIDESTANVTVQTQRSEVYSLNGEPQLTYATLRLQFNKISNEWKVNSATWQ